MSGYVHVRYSSQTTCCCSWLLITLLIFSLQLHIAMRCRASIAPRLLVASGARDLARASKCPSIRIPPASSAATNVSKMIKSKCEAEERKRETFERE